MRLSPKNGQIHEIDVIDRVRQALCNCEATAPRLCSTCVSVDDWPDHSRALLDTAQMMFPRWRNAALKNLETAERLFQSWRAGDEPEGQRGSRFVIEQIGALLGWTNRKPAVRPRVETPVELALRANMEPRLTPIGIPLCSSRCGRYRRDANGYETCVMGDQVGGPNDREAPTERDRACIPLVRLMAKELHNGAKPNG